METAEGILTLVQEGRFKLVTPEGRVLLFVLAHDAAIEAQDLPPLARAQTPVRVAYMRPDRLIAAVAHRLFAPDTAALETTG